MKLGICQLQNKRNEEILFLYKSGKTLEEIAALFNFTRSRAQQIVRVTIRKKIIKEFTLSHLTNDDEKMLNEAVRQEIGDICHKRKKISTEVHENEIIKRMQDKMSALPHYSIFDTLSDFARAMGEDAGLIKKYFPQIVKEIVNKRKSKWSWYYNKCRSCGTTSIKHQSRGLCEKCYFKSDFFKGLQEASRLRNQHRWEQKQRQYQREYAKRPEVIQRIKKSNDLKNFGGNGELALARDGYRCQKCGVTQKISLNKFKKDLFVRHVNMAGGDDIDNLTTLCARCFSMEGIKLMRARNREKLVK